MVATNATLLVASDWDVLGMCDVTSADSDDADLRETKAQEENDRCYDGGVPQDDMLACVCAARHTSHACMRCMHCEACVRHACEVPA